MEEFELKNNTKVEYNKDKIKESLAIEDIESIVAELGGEPINNGDHLVCKTICHCGDSHKLYYYDNTRLFKCYTQCSGDSFDIFELVCRVKNSNHQFKAVSTKNGIQTRPWELFDAIPAVLDLAGFSTDSFKIYTEKEKLQDWSYFNQCDKINQTKEQQVVELKYYDEDILKYLPQPIIKPWEREGITHDVLTSRKICFDPVSYSIIIPHYSMVGGLVGIRQRTLVKEDEIYGKYRPAYLNYKLYNHPLGFNLYNLNNSKDNIAAAKKAIVFEGEKSCLLYASYFGMENDISVAVCGSSLISYQVSLLKELGVKEIIIAFDKQFQEIGDDEFKKWTKKLTDIHTKYGAELQISYMFDKWNLLKYKDSPIDEGIDTFIELFKRRVYI